MTKNIIINLSQYPKQTQDEISKILLKHKNSNFDDQTKEDNNTSILIKNIANNDPVNNNKDEILNSVLIENNISNPIKNNLNLDFDSQQVAPGEEEINPFQVDMSQVINYNPASKKA